MKTFKQGQDVELAFEVVDTPAPDFSTADEIHVVLFVANKEQYKYSLNPKTGYGELTVEANPNTDTLHVFVERDHSTSFDVGKMTAHIIAQFPNANFPDGNETKVWDMTVARVLAGRALDDEIP